MVFTSDRVLPRTKAAVPQWVAALEALLVELPADDALRNRIRLLP
jgi:hypothetical protein